MARIMVNSLSSIKKVLKNFSEALVCWMSGKQLLAYDELVKLIEDGVIDAKLENVNGTSIDVTLHNVIRVEDYKSHITVKLYKGESIVTSEIDMLNSRDCCHVMSPGSVLLAATVERLNMPLNLSAEFSLKSSVGRSFLAHMLAGWVDPGFTGTLTLELKNDNLFHYLAIAPGQKIGQIKFFRHKRVPLIKSYAVRGQYNGQVKVQESNGIK
jgi:dCTP deaminase